MKLNKLAQPLRACVASIINQESDTYLTEASKPKTKKSNGKKTKDDNDKAAEAQDGEEKAEVQEVEDLAKVTELKIGVKRSSRTSYSDSDFNTLVAKQADFWGCKYNEKTSHLGLK